MPVLPSAPSRGVAMPDSPALILSGSCPNVRRLFHRIDMQGAQGDSQSLQAGLRFAAIGVYSRVVRGVHGQLFRMESTRANCGAVAAHANVSGQRGRSDRIRSSTDRF